MSSTKRKTVTTESSRFSVTEKSHEKLIREPAWFGNIRVDNFTQPEVLDIIDSMIATGGHHRMVVVNASKLVLASKNLKLSQILQSSDLITADGMSVVWASCLSKKFKAKLLERVTGIDTMLELCALASQKGYKVFLLGAKETIVKKAAITLCQKFQRLNIVGWHNGYFDNSQSSQIARKIQDTQADILFVAMGSPKQEEWIAEFGKLAGVSFCLGVGGSFDLVAGTVKRAPTVMQKYGLEWLYRFAQEPHRLWKRYLLGNINFLYFLAQTIKNTK